VIGLWNHDFDEEFVRDKPGALHFGSSEEASVPEVVDAFLLPSLGRLSGR